MTEGQASFVRMAIAGAVALIWGCSLPTVASAQPIVNKIKQRGYVICGASQGVPGLSRADEQGVWRGFDSDICRMLAVVIFGDKDKIRFTPLNAAQRLPAIQTGEIDALSRTTTMTYTRDAAVRFVAITIHDSDVLMVRKAANIVEEGPGWSDCVFAGRRQPHRAIRS